MVEKPFFALLALVCSLMVPALPAWAQNAETEKATATIRLFDHALLHPLPDWVEGLPRNAIVDASNYYRDENNGNFIFEMIPRSETFEGWTNMYAILARQHQGNTIAREIEEIALIFEQNCVQGKTVFFRVHESRDDAIIIALCGQYTAMADKGELALFRLFRAGPMNVRLFREWRGERFDVGDEAAWPAGRAAIETMIERFDTARLVEAQ